MLKEIEEFVECVEIFFPLFLIGGMIFLIGLSMAFGGLGHPKPFNYRVETSILDTSNVENRLNFRDHRSLINRNK